MNEKKYFFQDFLLENMPVDERDYPDVEIDICKIIVNYGFEFITKIFALKNAF